MKKLILNIILIFFLCFLPVSVTNAVIVVDLCGVTDGNNGDCVKKQQIYYERANKLSPYSRFFEEVGVKLTRTTSEEQYDKWLSKLISAKKDYDKEQREIADQKAKEEKKQKELIEEQEAEKIRKEKEAEEKIKELEKRIIQLEKPLSVVETIAPVEKVQPIVKKVEEKVIPVVQKEKAVNVQSTTTLEIEVMEKPVEKVGWFKRLINWFKK